MPLFHVEELVGSGVVLREQPDIPSLERIHSVLKINEVSPEEGISVGKIVVEAAQVIVFVLGLNFYHGRLPGSSREIGA